MTDDYVPQEEVDMSRLERDTWSLIKVLYPCAITILPSYLYVF